MSGRLDDDFEPTSDDTVEPGRGTVFTDVGEWVVLCPISDRACRVYWIFRAHVNRGRTLPNGKPDERAWPVQEDVAEMLRVKKCDTIGAAVRELVAIGAVDVRTERYHNGMRRRNIYTVHREPPEGFGGPLSTNDWYARRKAELEAFAAAE